MQKNKWMVGLLFIGTLAMADDIVEFHIASGTGSKPWNTQETTVNVKIGQTLRIINDDSVAHTLHTFGKPCPHQPDDSQPGEFYDCEITKTADPRVDLMYDHGFGEKARFFVKATN